MPINKNLPPILDEQYAIKRNKDEVAQRAMALLVVAVKGEGLPQAKVDKLVADYALVNHFSPKERQFIRNEKPSDDERLQFSWRYEAAWTLLWALGYVERLDRPLKICDAAKAVGYLRGKKPDQFIAEAKLRSVSDLLDARDLTYRYQWAVADANLSGRPVPAKLEPGVTYERHYALSWLLGPIDQQWDKVTPDT